MTLLRRLPPQMKGPAMARALTTPRTIVATGVVAAAAIAGGLPVLAVGGLAALAYALVSALTVARPRELAKVIFPDLEIDLGRLDRVALEQMQKALTARGAYRQALKDCPPGPFRDKFTDMGEKVDDVVDGLYKLVSRAQTLRGYLDRTPDEDKATELAKAQAALRAYPSGATHDQIAAQVEALEEQIKAKKRINDAYVAAMARIDATTARIDQLSAQITEVVLLADDPTSAASTTQVGELVDELDSLRSAIAEVEASTAAVMPSANGGARQAIAE